MVLKDTRVGLGGKDDMDRAPTIAVTGEEVSAHTGHPGCSHQRHDCGSGGHITGS